MGKADRYQKLYPVTWDQLHRDAKALAWRLLEQGPFKGIIGVARGGLVPAAIVARELNIRLVAPISPPCTPSPPESPSWTPSSPKSAKIRGFFSRGTPKCSIPPRWWNRTRR